MGQDKWLGGALDETVHQFSHNGDMSHESLGVQP